MTTSSSTGTKLTDRVSEDARTRLAAIIAVGGITWFLSALLCCTSRNGV